MKNSKKMQMKWYMNYLHTFGYYCDQRRAGEPVASAIARMKTFARQQPEFCQAVTDELITNMFAKVSEKFSRPNRAPQCIRAYYTRKANSLGW